MIYLNFSIQNPWRPQAEAESKDYFYKHWTLSEKRQKSAELQISKFAQANDLLQIRLDLRWWGEDHAGPKLEIDLWKFFFSISLYDHRHWDYENNCWEVYDEKDETND